MAKSTRKYSKKRSNRSRSRRRSKMVRYKRPSNPLRGVQVNLRHLGLINLTADFTASNQTFKLQDFLDYSVWSNIYTRFQIAYIKQVIYPVQNSYSSSTVLAYPAIPLCGWRTERLSDTAVFNSGDKMIENPRVKIRQLNKPLTLGFKPNVISNIYGSVLSTNNSAVYNQWLSTNGATDAQHFGLMKGFIAQGATALVPLKFRVITTATVKFIGMDTEQT